MVNPRGGAVLRLVTHAHSRRKTLKWNKKTRRRHLQIEKHFCRSSINASLNHR
jgi:hypothetical protein